VALPSAEEALPPAPIEDVVPELVIQDPAVPPVLAAVPSADAEPADPTAPELSQSCANAGLSAVARQMAMPAIEIHFNMVASLIF
jgi:hypothetical protein